MPNFGFWEIFVIFVIATPIVYSIAYLVTNQLEKDIKKIRQLWKNIKPDN